MKQKPLNSKTIISKLAGYGQRIRPYSFVLFIMLVAGLYSFVLFKINTIVSEQPSSDEVTSQVKAARVPHFDEDVIRQLNKLEDNSVSVQALFKEARDNPFDQN